MMPLHTVVVKPVGERHNNTRKIGGNYDFVVNSVISEQDYEYCNRIGEVTNVPRGLKELEVGDQVIVHYNLFRPYWGFVGDLMESVNYFGDNRYQAGIDEIYAVKRDGEWKTLQDYCFVEPIEDDAMWAAEKYKPLYGKIVFFNEDLLPLKKGDTIVFDPLSENKYDIDGKLMYLMRNVDLVCKV